MFWKPKRNKQGKTEPSIPDAAGAPEPADAASGNAKPGTPGAGEKSPYRPVNWDSATAIFDHVVKGIQRDRAYRERKGSEQQIKLDTDWQQVLTSMRELQHKLEGNPKLAYFTITRDNQEIALKIADDGAPNKWRNFTLSRRHPHGRYPALEVVWLLEFPGKEEYFRDAKQAMGELVSRIAGYLA